MQRNQGRFNLTEVHRPRPVAEGSQIPGHIPEV